MKKLVVILCAIVAVAGISIVMYLNLSEWREFLEPIEVPVGQTGDVIVIREWQYLLGSGADIYYRDSGGRERNIGKAGGGDDGYTPFANGEYDIEIHPDSVTLRWYFGTGSLDNPDSWRSVELYFR